MSNDPISTYAVSWGTNIVFALLIGIAGWYLTRVLVRLVRGLLARAGLDEILVRFVGSIVKVVLLLVVAIAALDRLGVDTTALIAVLGAAGIAVGLALKDSLQNFASGVMLIVFRPFKAGDYVEAGGTAGIVEHIAIFSTTMRTGDNRAVIVPNGAIYGSTITNYSARATRRLDMVFGISYDDDVARARELISGVLAADERVLADPEPVVALGELAESSVNLWVRPWVSSDDYWALRFDLLERIKTALEEEGMTIPFPQLDVHARGPAADRAA